MQAPIVVEESMAKNVRHHLLESRRQHDPLEAKLEAKLIKKLYGVTMAPIPCTEAWRRLMPFDHNSKGVVTYSYILVNRYTGERVHVNSYNGEAGVGYNALHNTYPIRGWHPVITHPWAALWPQEGKFVVCVKPLDAEVSLNKSLQIGKGQPYSRCLIGDCPMAVLAGPPVGWPGDPIVEPVLPVEVVES